MKCTLDAQGSLKKVQRLHQKPYLMQDYTYGVKFKFCGSKVFLIFED
jgi:hypothetical protein